MRPILKGSMVALITPFKNGGLDEAALRGLIAWHLKEGTDVLVPSGTTGEAPTLSLKEHERLIRVTVEMAGGKVPVLAGAGTNATAAAIELARQAKKAGADGMLQVTPYYNKPTQEGLFRHFEAIAKACDLPMVLYNVPGRTGVHMAADTTIRLSKIDTIVGIKEASGKLEEIAKIIRETGEDFYCFSGDDALNARIYDLGGMGTISVTANVAPARVAKVWNLFAAGKKEEALAQQEGLARLNKVLFLETNPIPVKTALHLMGKCEEIFRLPLCPMGESAKKELTRVLKEEKLLP